MTAPAGPTDKTLKAHGITRAEWQALYAAQGGRCAVTGKPPGPRGLVIDHDHRLAAKQGRRASVRGLVNSWSNRLIGVLRDNAVMAQQIADYLNDPPARRVLDLEHPPVVASTPTKESA